MGFGDGTAPPRLRNSGSCPESESESPGVVVSSQELESESVGNPESELESEQRQHDSATLRCKLGFSAMVAITTKAKKKLDLRDDLRCALSLTKPRIPN